MPNSAIMKQLGASQELIDYIRETPENTNFAIVEVIESSGSGTEVWLVGNDYIDEDGMRLFVLSNVGETDHVAELFANGNNYQIFLNGTELPYYSDEESLVRWMDTDSTATVTSSVYVQYVGDLLAARSGYMDASTAPTSVEVSVKAK